ncbi:hypothetical protein N8J89_08060 [Crossiella sp. CA-258035]|uniref:phage tail fiber protein n=1 Tax=Crossiella sp. CA-258035 TaxID=2981138 RepID=UPI0024BCF5CD|nr:hypothetical protein [Crossiella sp. CA-258035]WHT21009.1 hypothetical protein N8J89_08060 [Crossiella sp. CA-258035]
MPFTDTAKNAAVNGVAGGATWISLHTADPGTTGTAEVTGGSYARVQTTWGAAASGSRVGSQAVINVPAGTTITHWGIWSASTSGTFYYSGTLPASETFGSAGTYGLTPTLTAS